MADKAPVVFIHGLWIHSVAWKPWEQRFAASGYATHAPGWPGDAVDVAQTRADPAAVANHGIDDITRSYAKFIRTLDSPPVVIGHSFGGADRAEAARQSR